MLSLVNRLFSVSSMRKMRQEEGKPPASKKPGGIWSQTGLFRPMLLLLLDNPD